MSGEYHRGGNPANEVDSDQDNDAATSSGRAPLPRLELPSAQGSAENSRKRSREQNDGTCYPNIRPRTAGVQQVMSHPSSPPRPAAQEVGRAEAAPPGPGHHRPRSAALPPTLGPPPALGASPGFGYNIFDARTPLSQIFHVYSQYSAMAETSPPYDRRLSSSRLNSSSGSRLHLARGNRSSRPINQQDVFSNHLNITIELRDGTNRLKPYRGVMVSRLPTTIIHVSTAEQLGWVPLSLAPIANTSYNIRGMGPITPRKWLYAEVKFGDFEGLIDVYVASDDYPPFQFVLLQDTSLEPLGTRRDETEYMTGFDLHAQPGSELQLVQPDHAASTLHAASTHGGPTTANITFFAPSDPSLSFDFASSGFTDFGTNTGQEGYVQWMPNAATMLLSAQPESKVSQHDDTMATPHADFYGQDGQGFGDPPPAFR